MKWILVVSQMTTSCKCAIDLGFKFFPIQIHSYFQLIQPTNLKIKILKLTQHKSGNL